MIRRRFADLRAMRIIGWTAMAVAWGTAIFVRNAAAEIATIPEEDPVLAAAVTTITAAPSVPVLPERGLVVLRYTPDRVTAEPTVVRRVVQRAASNPAASAPAPADAPVQQPAPKKTRSSGS